MDFFLPISFLRRLGTNRWVTCSLPVMVQLNARTARPAGILEAQLTQHIALFEKMCGPVKHVRLAVRRRKKGGQGRGRKRKSDERVVVDVASWEEEEVQSFRVVPAGAESSEWLARRIKLVKFDERLGAGAEGGSGGSGGSGGGRGEGGGFTSLE